MRVRLVFSIAAAILAAGLLSAQSGGEHEGRIFGNAGDIRADAGAVEALVAAPLGTGLEVDDFTEIKVVVSSVPASLQEIGLTQSAIRSRVVDRLQQVGFAPLDETDGRGEWLSIEINGIGSANRVGVSFTRRTFYAKTAGADVFVPDDVEVGLIAAAAVTWNTGSVGTHAGDANYVVSTIDRHLEQFLQAYIEANDR
jgi:hypothetical protein